MASPLPDKPASPDPSTWDCEADGHLYDDDKGYCYVCGAPRDLMELISHDA